MPKQTTLPTLPIPPELIERKIYLLREQKVMLDSDWQNFMALRPST